MRRMRLAAFECGVAGVALLSILSMNCSRSNNLVLGRVTMRFADHNVVVTDCYRTTVPRPAPAAQNDGVLFHWAPCRDADITIRERDVVVNGRTYGPLMSGDAITVDHGKVLIADSPAKEVAP